MVNKTYIIIGISIAIVIGVASYIINMDSGELTIRKVSDGTIVGEKVSITGKVNIRDNCWFIETEQPALYLLVDAPNELLKEGLVVSIKGEIVERPEGYCMHGVPISITEYTIRSVETINP